MGGDLSPARLIQAYRQGIFPWFNDGDPILWWSPNPRAVMFLDQLHIGRSLKKTIRRQQFTVSMDREFEAVIKHCAMPRAYEAGTWITGEMMDAYIELHRLGVAHSIEIWQKNRLVGGLYGVALGKVFFGESMFSLVSGASKVAFVQLAKQLQQWQYTLIDCQVSSEHLKTMGATEINRNDFIKLLDQHATGQQNHHHWNIDNSFAMPGEP